MARVNLDKSSALKISTIKSKTFRAKQDLEAIIDDKRLHVADQLQTLEVLKILDDHDYVLFLLSDKSGLTPKVISWAYAEKTVDNKSIIFSSGSGGGENDDMFIESCAVLSRQNQNSDMQQVDYVTGAKLKDENDEIEVLEQYSDEQYASFITNIVNPSAVGLVRNTVSASEDDVKAILDNSTDEDEE